MVRLRGQQLTLPYLAQHGWERPILIDSVEGLGMQLPPAADFTVHDIENYVGTLTDDCRTGGTVSYRRA